MVCVSFNLYWYAELENVENPFMLIFYFCFNVNLLFLVIFLYNNLSLLKCLC